MAAPVRAPIKLATQNLWHIARIGDLDQMEQALARGADVNSRNNFGLTPLIMAAYNGQTEMVKMLIEHGADPHAVDSGGLTAAMLAQSAGHEETANALIELGVKTTRTPRPAKPVSIRPAPVEIVETAEEEPVSIRPAPVEIVETVDAERIFIRPAPVETVETADDVEKTNDNASEIRTLHEPPEIWDLVHETPSEVKSSATFVRPFRAVRAISIAAVLLIIGGAFAFWFTTLRALPQPDTGAASSLKTSEPSVSSETAVSSDTTASADQQLTRRPDHTNSVNNQFDDATNSEMMMYGNSPISEVVTKAPRQPRAGLRPRHEVSAHKPGRQSAAASLTLGPKSENEKVNSPAGTKESGQTIPSRPPAPPQNNAPKPKVIPWP